MISYHKDVDGQAVYSVIFKLWYTEVCKGLNPTPDKLIFDNIGLKKLVAFFIQLIFVGTTEFVQVFLSPSSDIFFSFIWQILFEK